MSILVLTNGSNSKNILVILTLILIPSFVRIYKVRGRVQTTWTEFWAMLTPSPLCRHFYLIAVTKCCGHLSNPLPLICPRGLYTSPKIM